MVFVFHNVIHNKKNLGVAKTRNLGLNIATGKYIVFLDMHS